MKPKLLLGMLITLIFAVSFVHADVIPENSHALNGCLKFVNLNDYPDVVLVTFLTGPMIDTYQADTINNNSCLPRGYWANTLSIYWTTKEKFDTLDLAALELGSNQVPTGGYNDDGSPNYHAVFYPKDLSVLLENVKIPGGYISNTNHSSRLDIEYSIAGYNDGNLVVYISKQTTEYNDGTARKVETFSAPAVNNIPPSSDIPPSPVEDLPQDDNSSFVTPPPLPEPEPTPEPEPLPVTPPEPQSKGFWSSIGCFFTRLFGGSC